MAGCWTSVGRWQGATQKPIGLQDNLTIALMQLSFWLFGGVGGSGPIRLGTDSREWSGD